MGGKKSKQTHVPLKSLPSRRRIVQNFLLVWLDSSIDETKNDCRNTITHLKRIVNTINIFTDPEQCINFLAQIKDEKVFMIISGALGENIMSVVHDMSQVGSIYIFCKNKSIHEQWVKEWSKIKGVFTQITSICESLKQAAQQCDENFIPVSFHSTNDETFQQDFNQLDPSFMYTQILKEILLEIKYNKQFIKDLALYCRDLYTDNDHELKNIIKFEREYRRRSPIWWYTYDCCIYSMLNRALRIQEVDTIIRMGFFIQDLHRHIERLHKEQFSDRRKLKSFIVYRGQSLSQTDFDKLIKTKDGVISFNSFLSTSKKRELSLDFTHRAMQTNPQSIGILFKMNIDPSVSSTPFALLNKVSYYKDSEEEILFSMHTVFRIGNIEQMNDDDNHFWQVELTLIDDNDKQLSILTERIRQETRDQTGWPRLGNLLIRLGNFDTAEQVFSVLLDLTVNDMEKAHFYHQIGVIKDNQGRYTEAISFYEKSLQINEKHFPPYHSSLAASYKSIGLVYNNMEKYSEALLFHEKALEIEQYILPPNHSSLATTYNNIGLVLCNMKEYSKALLFYQKALQIHQKTLPVKHPLFATTYNNIGLIYKHMEDYSQALLFHERAVEIGRCSLTMNHPHLQLFRDNLEFVKTRLTM